MIRGAGILWLMILLCCGLAAGCSNQDGGSSEPAPTRPRPTVLVQQLSPADISFEQTFVGHVEGIESVEVRAQVSGILRKRFFRDGEAVQAGQVLFEIEPGPFQAQVDQAASRVTSLKARLDNARRDLDRAVPLAERNSISQRDRDLVQTEYESAKAGLAEAEATLRAARIELDQTRIKAPIGGFASMAEHNEGSLIAAGSPDSLLTTIHNVHKVQIVFSVPDTQVRRIQGFLASERAVMDKTVPARLSIDQNHAYPHNGTMTFGNPVISRETGCMLAKAVFPNPDRTLLPGQVVRIHLSLLTFPAAIAIPEQAVLQGQTGAMVVVVDDAQTASFRPIEILTRVGRQLVVSSGLDGTERIIVEGTGKVGPGMPVNVRENPEPDSRTQG